ncbi:LuxR family transcriptional regulator [uncultured Bosea sp.]|uniref:LuxR family transcriptional regulator n=1 Tax=uncultured Bosea sp. TaxID=211457 RepID=UPI0025DC607B|nr:LuxR family transcriptional regulator [uncultured Bosea sp.]
MSMIDPFAEALLRCGNLAEVGATFAAVVAKEGFVSSAARALSPSAGQPVQTFFLNWPENWQMLSEKRQFTRKSPIFRATRRRSSPFTWRELQAERRQSDGEKEVWRTVKEWGWTDGLVVPIHGPGGYFAAVGMSTRERSFKVDQSKRMRLIMLATATHERCRMLLDLDRSDDAWDMLTARELECLRWVADGQSDDAIGSILAISSETVRFHLGNARQKLGVRNRAQAVAQICLRGLL